MASRTLQVVITGDSSSLERALGRAKTSGDSFGGTLGKVSKMAGLAVGGAALGGLAVVLKAGTSEFMNSQKSAAQTAAVLRSTGDASNVTAKQVDELAKSLSNKSGVDHNVIQSGENVLLTFTNIRNEAGKGNDVFNQTQKATLDLSVAMGEDLKSASVQVGKALNDPLTGMKALQRVGVTFTEQQKNTIKALLDTAGAAKASASEIKKDQQEVASTSRAVTSAQNAVAAAAGRVQAAQLAAAAADRQVTAAQDAVAASAQHVQDAQQAVTAATQKVTVARTAEVDAVHAVKDAQQAEADSVQRVKDAQTANLDAIHRVTDARTAEKNAVQNVRNAQQGLLDSQAAEKASEEALTQARIDATNALIDLNNASIDASFSAQDAEIALERAQANLAKVMGDSTSTDLDKREATLQVAEAQQHLTEAQKNATDAQTANAKAQQDGVDGSKQVVDAKNAVHRAQEQEAKSARAIVLAQQAAEKAAYAVVKAQQDQQRSSRAIVTAQEAQHKSAWAIVLAQQKQQAAARGIIDAQRGLVAAQQHVADANLKAVRAQQALVVAQDAAKRAADNVTAAQGNASKAAGNLTAAEQKAKEAHDKLTAAHERGKKIMQNTTNLVKAQKIVLGELNKEFGGSAVAAGKTLPGQLDILKHKFNEASATVVAAMIPALTAIVNKVSQDWPQINAVFEKFAGLIRDDIAPIVRRLGVIFEESFSKIGQVIEKNGPALKRIWLDVKPLIEAFVWYNQNVVLPVMEYVFETVIPTAIDLTVKALGILLAPIRLAGAVVTNFSTIVGAARNTIGTAVSDVKGFFVALPGKLAETLKTLASKAITPFKEAFTGAKDWVDQKTGQIVGFFVALPASVFATVKDLGSTALKPFKDAFTSARDWVGSRVDDIVGFFVKLPGRLFATLKDLTGKAIDPLRTAFGAVGGALASAVKLPINMVIAAIDALEIPPFSLSIDTHIPGVGKVGFDYGGSGAFFDIPKLDTGGTIMQTGLAVVHKGENYSGVGANRRWAPGGGNVYNFSFPNYVGNERDLMTIVQREVARTGQRNGGNVFGGVR